MKQFSLFYNVFYLREHKMKINKNHKNEMMRNDAALDDVEIASENEIIMMALTSLKII